MTPIEKLRRIADSTALDGVADAIREVADEMERERNDPLDTPLPCDITVGHVTIKRGVPLRTLVTRMQVLYDMARQHSGMVMHEGKCMVCRGTGKIEQWTSAGPKSTLVDCFFCKGTGKAPAPKIKQFGGE